MGILENIGNGNAVTSGAQSQPDASSRALSWIGRPAKACSVCRGLDHWVSQSSNAISCSYCRPSRNGSDNNNDNDVALRIVVYRGVWEVAGQRPTDFAAMQQSAAEVKTDAESHSVRTSSMHPHGSAGANSWIDIFDPVETQRRNSTTGPVRVTQDDLAVVRWIIDWIDRHPEFHDSPPAAWVSSQSQRDMPGVKISAPDCSSDFQSHLIRFSAHEFVWVENWRLFIDRLRVECSLAPNSVRCFYGAFFEYLRRLKMFIQKFDGEGGNEFQSGNGSDGDNVNFDTTEFVPDSENTMEFVSVLGSGINLDLDLGLGLDLDLNLNLDLELSL